MDEGARPLRRSMPSLSRTPQPPPPGACGAKTFGREKPVSSPSIASPCRMARVSRFSMALLPMARLHLMTRSLRAALARWRPGLRRFLAPEPVAWAVPPAPARPPRWVEEMAEQEAQLTALFESVNTGVAEIDLRRMRYIRVNRRYCEITGWTREALMASTDLIAVVHPEDRARLEERWVAVARAQGVLDFELRYQRPDGRVVWVRLASTVSARDARGQAIRSVAILQEHAE